ncbi:MAG TPA: hypothetical protein VI076_16120, partial [Actinopolymorphaceae bacterium]
MNWVAALRNCASAPDAKSRKRAFASLSKNRPDGAFSRKAIPPRDAGWDIQVANDLESAWAALTPGPKRFIFYDDFLGATELALTAETGDLLRLIERSRSRPDVRLVLTTRSQILNRARELEDRVAELTRRREVVVQVGDHSYEIRAHILRNHLYFSRLNPVERDRIRLDNRLTTAVRHPSYNPRLIASVTDEITETSTADEVTERLLAVLNKPEELWRATFLRMDRLRRDILLTLATLPPVPHPVSDLLALVTVEDAVQWAPAMSELEPTWIRHVDRPPRNVVVLANPGCRDFLLNVLDDAAVANEQLAKARRLDQYVALTRAAGLQHGTVTRPALAEVLKRRAREILEAVRALTLDTLAVESPAKDQLATIADAVLLASVYGTEDGTSWVLDLVAEQLPAWGRLDASTRDFLRVAERLVELP